MTLASLCNVPPLDELVRSTQPGKVTRDDLSTVDVATLTSPSTYCPMNFEKLIGASADGAA